MEITFEGEQYLIVPHVSILVLVRDASNAVDTDELLGGLDGIDGLEDDLEL